MGTTTRAQRARLRAASLLCSLILLCACCLSVCALQVEAKNDPKAYKARVRKLVRDSLDSL